MIHDQWSFVWIHILISNDGYLKQGLLILQGFCGWNHYDEDDDYVGGYDDDDGDGDDDDDNDLYIIGAVCLSVCISVTKKWPYKRSLHMRTVPSRPST